MVPGSLEEKMKIKDINCKCPKCGEVFQLSDALEEHALDQVGKELSALNEKENQIRLEKEIKAALKQERENTSDEAFQKQVDLDKKQQELDAILIEKRKSDAKIKRSKIKS